MSGVETTTGPLGQGVATSVGMAIAEKWLANRYNRPDFEIFDYNIYTVCGDGCHDGGRCHRKRHRWRVTWRSTTSAGSTTTTTSRSKAVRASPLPRTLRLGSSAYGWNVLRVGDANDIDRIEHALDVFTGPKDRPTFIILDSHIGYGSPHGRIPPPRMASRWATRKSALPNAITVARGRKVPGSRCRACHASPPGSVRAARRRTANGMNGLRAYRAKYPELANEIDLMQRRELPAGWDRGLPVFPADAKGIAGRDASGKVLNVLAQNIPWLLGGSADLGTVQQDHLDVRGRRDFAAGQPAAAETCISESASTRWRPLSTGFIVEAARLRRDVLHLQRLRAAGHPAFRPDGAAHYLRIHPRCHG